MQGADLTGVGHQPGGGRDGPDMLIVDVLVDQQDLVSVVQQLAGDGATHTARSGNDNSHVVRILSGDDLSRDGLGLMVGARSWNRGAGGQRAGGSWSSVRSTAVSAEAVVRTWTRSPSW